jgi:nucleoside triphosphate diphosphatase
VNTYGGEVLSEPESAGDGALTGRERSAPEPGSLDRALALVRFLRANCPWDAEQTPESLVPYLLEESHEVVDAIQDGDERALEGELGDLLLNLAFQIVIAEEEGRFDAGSVVSRLEEKMRRRHPHLYGLGEREGWEALKARERAAAGEGAGVLDGMARGLDPLTGAHRIQQRVAGVGFDWSDYRGAFDKVAEELAEVGEAIEAAAAEGAPSAARDAVEEELGDLLFAAVNLVRLAGAHPTPALARANRKFRRRFERLEALARERGVALETAGLEALDRLWDEIKGEEG